MKKDSVQEKDLRATIKKALAWFRLPELVTEPEILQGYKAPESVVCIGTIKTIGYRSNKFTGKNENYEHVVTKRRELFISRDGATLIVWPPFKVTTRGIEG